MSASEPAHKGKSKLVVQSAIGVEIQILDAAYAFRAGGHGTVTATLPDGIYMVNASSGGMTSQAVVRLPGSTNPLAIELPLPQPSGPVRLLKSYSDLDVPKDAEQLEKALRPSELPRESEILIVIRDRDAQEDLRRSLRLFDTSLRAMRSNAEIDADQELGIAARRYSIDPGEYRLQFLSLTGERMHQTVPALPGRRTIVLMRSGPATMLRPEGDRFKRISTHGVDAARTVIFTTLLGDELVGQSEAVRIAEFLLSKLMTGPSDLSTDIIALLENPCCDPLLLVYGAACLVSGTESKHFPGTTARPRKSEAPIASELSSRWMERAAKSGVRSDVVALRWRMGARTVGSSKWSKLASPPMLEIAWRWAAAQSIKDSRAVPQTVVFQGAISGQCAAGPWLSWSAAAAKGGPTKPKQLTKEHMNDLVRKVAGKFDKIAKSWKLDASAEVPLRGDAPLARLTSRAYAEWKSRGKPQPSPAEVLAARSAAPAPELERRLLELLTQLDIVGGGSANLRPFKASPTTERAPGLRRLIKHPDDPHKGRFGELAKAKGFSVEAMFPKSGSKQFVPVRLTVTGPPEANGEAAYFHLHDSFEPDRYMVKFARGKASLSIRTWGGFTLGVWIPRFGAELELDLATLADAPRIVKER